jgi:DNA-directed RNA polymerase specialized sigma24 family protein
MFDPLLEEDPWVKEKVAEGEAKGRAEGKAEAASKELVRLVRRHYPALLDLAKARATKGDAPDVIEALIEQLWDAPNEQAARTLLETYPAS